MKFRYVAIIAALLVSGGAACGKKVPDSITSPQARNAYVLEDAVDAVSAIQHEAIIARRAGVIQTPTMRAIVKTTIAVNRTMSDAIDAGGGTNAVLLNARSALRNARDALSDSDKQRLAVWFDAADQILTKLMGE